ncbi:LET1 protein [Coccidioides immitis RMSCC 3703]|uniref:Cytosolic Fe-S cluster assembly factor NAR1 n=1 Tax=Coccidioides immitis RMSCC 3703 TaxID=454286 RepID=A0A0J8QYF9_COCIT|nr:LET1 protein [Coccidioides immitis RMSCC 3703]
MSAILSADDLNDFISPGVACIKPVETLPAKSERDEAVLISLQSHAEVLNTLDAYPELRVDGFRNGVQNGATGDARIFVASVSPQVRASMAATYGVSEKEAGYMIEQFLSGPQGLRAGGQHGSGFTWVVDTNVIRDVVLELTTDEVTASRAKFDSTATSESAEFPIPRQPILSSACPGWICYAEKTHPHVLPHLSRLKSPQALTGTFIKTILSKRLNVPPSRIWHLAIMPCFDKKLEASRQELTDASWQTTNHDIFASPAMDQPIRDVDCGYLHHLLTPIKPSTQQHYPSQRGRNADVIDYTLVSAETGRPIIKAARYYGFRNIQNLVRKLKPAKTSRLPGARAAVSRRTGISASHTAAGGGVSDYAYIEVMACPGGCTNGGGQIRVEDARDTATIATSSIDGSAPTAQTSQHKPTPQEQRAWLARVDEVYYSADSDSHPPSSPSTSLGDEMEIDRPLEPESRSQSVHAILQYWSDMTGIPLPKLVYTTFRKVESDVGKSKNGAADTARVAELAGKIGGGW